MVKFKRVYKCVSRFYELVSLRVVYSPLSLLIFAVRIYVRILERKKIATSASNLRCEIQCAISRQNPGYCIVALA